MIRHRTTETPRSRFLSAVIVGGAALLFTGCNRRTEAVAPPDVRYGQVDCAECGMTVSDERYAAALLTRGADGEQVARVFDDIGCMIEFEREHPEVKVLAPYVKDFESHQWLRADRAAYVQGEQIRSPMGFGLLAADSSEHAAKLANGRARALDLPGLRATLQKPASPVTDAGARRP